jgi:amidophosphoribosyltransferase
MQNAVKAIYAPFADQEISDKVAKLVTPDNAAWKGKIDVIFQTIPNLHAALGEEFGDWYFSGNYPTPGGFAVVNKSFVNFYRGRGGRGYGETLL